MLCKIFVYTSAVHSQLVQPKLLMTLKYLSRYFQLLLVNDKSIIELQGPFEISWSQLFTPSGNFVEAR